MDKLTFGSFFRNFLQMIHDLLTSKKVMMAVGTVVTAFLAHDPDLKKIAVGAGLTLLLGQGMADFGKEAKAAPTASAVVVAPVVDVPAPVPASGALRGA